MMNALNDDDIHSQYYGKINTDTQYWLEIPYGTIYNYICISMFTVFLLVYLSCWVPPMVGIPFMVTRSGAGISFRSHQMISNVDIEGDLNQWLEELIFQMEGVWL